MGTPPIEFGSIGMADSLILMVMALVVFGPRRLPQIGRQIGKLMYEFRKASNDFKFQMEEELRIAEDADRRKQEEERRKQLKLDVPAQESVSADPPPAQVNAIESPYPGEGIYPGVTDSETAHAEETAPRILPPSTGEQVAAARPMRQAAMAEPASEAEDATKPDTTGPEPEVTTPQASTPGEKTDATEPAAPATEAVSRNG